MPRSLSVVGGILLVPLVAAVGFAQQAQQDPLLGSWQGILDAPEGEERRITITFIRRGDGYGGSISGLGDANEIPLTNVMVTGTNVSAEVAADSRLGNVTVTYDFALEGDVLKGTGEIAVVGQTLEVALELKKRRRRGVPQPQVDQRLEYFVGTWKFEYTGAEYPPLSIGPRTGTATFTQIPGSNFLEARIEGESFGDKYEESLLLGYNEKTKMFTFVERLSTGAELVSLADWTSPIAIHFDTTPVTADGQTLRLQRTIAVTSDLAFIVTEEYSVDGGPFRRLGNGHFTKVRAAQN